MAGQFSNLGASSSTRARMQEEIKRKQDATRGEEAKKQRHSQLNDVTAHSNGAAVPVMPLQYAASSAMATAFPMAGVNGAALRWNTAATLGAASRAAVLSLPVVAGANGPAATASSAPAPGLQAPVAASNVAAQLAPPTASVNGVTAPLMLARAAGQLVPVPLQFIGYGRMASVSCPPAAPDDGLPLAAALDKIKNDTLRSMLSALMPVCKQQMRQRQSWTVDPPRWWPTAVPFAPAYRLKKLQKVAVMVAIVKHHGPDLDQITSKVSHKFKWSVEDANQWRNAVANEAAKRYSDSVPKTPLINIILLQQRPHGDGHRQAASCATTTENVVHGGIAAANGCEQAVNLAGASVTAPANDGGQVVTAAVPEQQQEQHSNGVVATDALAGYGPPEPVNFRGDDGIPLGDEVHQVAAELGLEPEQHGAMNVGDFDAADLDQLLEDMLAPLPMQQGDEAHQEINAQATGADAAVEEAPEEHPCPWYMEVEDMSSMFDDFEF